MQMKEKKNLANPIIWIVFAILMIYALTLILMLVWGLMTSFKSTDEFKIFGNVIGFPKPEYDDGNALKFQNYIAILKSFSFYTEDESYISGIFGEISNPSVKVTFGTLLFNSFVYSILGAFFQTLTSLIVAYMCQKYNFKFSEFLYVLTLIVMTIPIVGAFPSTLTIMRDLGIYDSYLGMILLNVQFGGVYFFVFHAFFRGIPNTYMEAAEIDGASQLTVFLNVILPLCANVFGTVFLINFIALWNDYQTPLLYYPNHPTLAYGVYNMSVETSGADKGFDTQSLPQRVAGCMLLVVPIFVIFMIFNEKLMGNLTMGGIKG
ncbi:MAG: carbohydrate ABC transporter permease [Clostridiales bacterium]|nr:carbohydrate ABC transporter permease [Clostridiales bacterium]